MKQIASVLIVTFVLVVSIFSFAGCKDMVKNVPNDESIDIGKFELTFEDNFDGNKLDTTKWRFFNGKVKGREQYLDHNYRAGFYSDDAKTVFLKDGKLHISTNYQKDGKYGEGWYSSWIETSTGDDPVRCFDESSDYKGFSQKYGYFEVRCICPPAEGLWSAFWLMPDEGVGLSNDDEQWTAKDGAELDVVESQNYFRKKSYCQHVVHSDYTTDGKGVLRSDKSNIFNVKDMYTNFHTYGVEWTADKIIFYIDGFKTYETEVVYDGKVLGTPDVKESMILSVEMAGYADKDGKIHVGKDTNGKKSWLGTLDNMDKAKTYDFIIDYVRAYKHK